MDVTFKKHPKEKGLAHVAYPYQNVDIKLDKKRIGELCAPSWQDTNWRIMLSVMKTETDDNPNCNWKNITLKAKFSDEETARIWVKDNIDTLSKVYTFNYS
jgi:hypothetical protein